MYKNRDFLRKITFLSRTSKETKLNEEGFCAVGQEKEVECDMGCYITKSKSKTTYEIKYSRHSFSDAFPLNDTILTFL